MRFQNSLLPAEIQDCLKNLTNLEKKLIVKNLVFIFNRLRVGLDKDTEWARMVERQFAYMMKGVDKIQTRGLGKLSEVMMPESGWFN